MSSTSGLRSGRLLNEIRRQKQLRQQWRRRAETQRKRAEMWKQRAQAAEWALRNKRKAA